MKHERLWVRGGEEVSAVGRFDFVRRRIRGGAFLKLLLALILLLLSTFNSVLISPLVHLSPSSNIKSSRGEKN
jgi:hypothetical protein